MSRRTLSLVTNRRIWHEAASLPDRAWAQLGAWAESPSCRLLAAATTIVRLLWESARGVGFGCGEPTGGRIGEPTQQALERRCRSAVNIRAGCIVDPWRERDGAHAFIEYGKVSVKPGQLQPSVSDGR